MVKRTLSVLVAMSFTGCGGGSSGSGSGASAGGGMIPHEGTTSSSTGGPVAVSVGPGGSGGTGGAGSGASSTTSTGGAPATGTGGAPAGTGGAASGSGGAVTVGPGPAGSGGAPAGSSVTSSTTGMVFPSAGSSGDSGAGGAGGSDVMCVTGTKLPCYDGPATTKGVGPCKEGVQTCLSSGMDYSACVGEVLPTSEDCTVPVDSNCDGVIPTCQAFLAWAKIFGDASDQTVTSVATDSSGNVFVTGYLKGSINFGGGALASAGGYDIYLAKLSPSGAHLWSKRFGGANAQFANTLAVDSSGNVILAGYFQDNLDFGTGSLPTLDGSAGTPFVAKLDGSGTTVFAKAFATSALGVPYSVAADPSGNILIGGTVNGTIDFGGGTLTTENDDAFVVKLSPSGTHLWSHIYGGAGTQGLFALRSDKQGNVLLTGSFIGPINFGGTTLTAVGSDDVYLAKLNPDGTHAWSKRFGDMSAQNAYGLATGPNNEVVVAGAFIGVLDFGGGSLTAAGGTDIFVAKLDASGNHVFSKVFGDTQDQAAYGVAIDGSGNVLLAGTVEGTTDFGGGPLKSGGADDAFAAKLSPTGAHVWSHVFGNATHQQGNAAAVDGSGAMFFAGTMDGGADFGRGGLISAGGTDAFVAKLNP